MRLLLLRHHRVCLPIHVMFGSFNVADWSDFDLAPPPPSSSSTTAAATFDVKLTTAGGGGGKPPSKTAATNHPKAKAPRKRKPAVLKSKEASGKQKLKLTRKTTTNTVNAKKRKRRRRRRKPNHHGGGGDESDDAADDDGDEDSAADDDDDDDEDGAAAAKKRRQCEDDDPPLTFSELTPDEQKLYLELLAFFNTTSIIDSWVKPMISKEQENNSMFSGRLLDFCLTNYVKDHDARYFLLFDKRAVATTADADDATTPEWGAGARPSRYFETLEELLATAKQEGRTVIHKLDWLEFDLMSEYKMMIRRYCKVFFDLFRRGAKFHFNYLTPTGEKRSTVTTFCQLTFFRWAACFQLHEYWNRHHQEVRNYYQQMAEDFDAINARKKQTIMYSRAYNRMESAEPIRKYGDRTGRILVFQPATTATSSTAPGNGNGNESSGNGGGEDDGDGHGHDTTTGATSSYKMWRQFPLCPQPQFYSRGGGDGDGGGESSSIDHFDWRPYTSLAATPQHQHQSQRQHQRLPRLCDLLIKTMPS